MFNTTIVDNKIPHQLWHSSFLLLVVLFTGAGFFVFEFHKFSFSLLFLHLLSSWSGELLMMKESGILDLLSSNWPGMQTFYTHC